MYEIILRQPPQNFIKRLEKGEQKAILDEIEKLAENPRIGKELKKRLTGFRSIRIDSKDSYRVVYKVEEGALIVLVVLAGYRWNVYDKSFGK